MKKFLAYVLAALLAFGTFTLTAAADTTFIDMPDDWSTAALQSAVTNKLLTGDGNKILPKDNLTRAQMAAIMVRAFGAEAVADMSVFSDVPETAWYYKNVSVAVNMGIFKGDGTGLLRPNDYITRQEVFVVLARAFGLDEADEAVLDTFKDKDIVASWAKGATASLVASKYVSGANGYLNAKSYITRAEFAQLMYNLVKTYIDESGVVTDLPEGNVIVRASNVTIKDTEIKGDVIIGDGVKGFKLENATVSGRTVYRDVLTGVSSGEEDKEEEKEEEKDDTGSGTTPGGTTPGGTTPGGTTPGGNTPGGNDPDPDGPTIGGGDNPEGGEVEDPDDYLENEEGWSGIYKP